MLFPFLIVECLPRRRADLVLAAIVATTWIALSPYYASWGDPSHWWVYAVLGTMNSLFFVWLGWKLARGGDTETRRQGEGETNVSGWLQVVVVTWGCLRGRR